MRLSIITINYNNCEGLRRTAQSVVAQTFSEFEWIVIDGSSNDGSVDIIKFYDKHIRYWVSEPDKGIYNAMNKGIAQASGEYLLFLNSGDIFCSPKSLIRATRVPWICDFVAFDEFVDGGRFLKSISTSPRKINYLFLLIGSLPHQSLFIKKTIMSQGYNEDYHIISDNILCFEQLIVNDATYQCYNIPITLYDSTGISSTNHEMFRKELYDYQGQYFDNKIRPKIKKTSTPIDAIESLFILNRYKRLIIVAYKFLMFLYPPFHFIIKLYMNIRYIDRRLINL